MKIICLQINKKLRNTCNPILHAELVFTYYAASILRVKKKQVIQNQPNLNF